MAGAIAVWPLKRIRNIILVLVAVIILTVLYLDVHWPIDIIAGLALGTVTALVAITIVEKWKIKESISSRTRSEGK
jgi:membrane-associated phospholipid phosphatase